MREWLRTRGPAPPAQLFARLQRALEQCPPGAAEDTPEACIAAAERVLRELLRGGCDRREAALDLLAADALATYAFEVAADRPEQLDARAAAAMQRFAAVATMTHPR